MTSATRLPTLPQPITPITVGCPYGSRVKVEIEPMPMQVEVELKKAWDWCWHRSSIGQCLSEVKRGARAT
ncbi:hypothetical protein E2562_009655 [Oryza meyeriana var. granulata]|uniref:Uncharacterized protein n=1 Tax=Oryza meyeriana var. granulata TaxID=110450 RepID=A0A6G1D0P9_9ORYZ|nr:hypothetical protein E2562_009655 [Oryza meyeriana var. granulata]